jgi:hypothetical protein
MQPVILSEVIVRNANDNAVEGPHSRSGNIGVSGSSYLYRGENAYPSQVQYWQPRSFDSAADSQSESGCCAQDDELVEWQSNLRVAASSRARVLA